MYIYTEQTLITEFQHDKANLNLHIFTSLNCDQA